MAIYGINLGEYECTAARLNADGKPVILRNQADGSDSLPSAILFQDPQKLVIGAEAWKVAVSRRELVAQHPAHWMAESTRIHTYHGKDYTGSDLLGILLGQLRENAQKLGEPMTGAVLTLPVLIAAGAESGLRDACRKAGLPVEQIIREPLAAVLGYYDVEKWEDRTVMVFDLGGSCLDVSILRLSRGTTPGIQILSAVHRDDLGTGMWDDLAVAHVMHGCREETGMSDDGFTAEILQQIATRSELAKKMLSFSSYTKVRINIGGSTVGVPLTREDFESRTSSLVSDAMATVRQAMSRADQVAIDQVLLVGGGCHMPMIRDALERDFPGKLQYMDPELLTARGAAVYAGLLARGQQIRVQEPTRAAEPERKVVAAPVKPIVETKPQPGAGGFAVQPIPGVYGVDLGDLSCAIATLREGGLPNVIRDLENASDTLDSVLYIGTDGKAAYGAAAREMGYFEPLQSVDCFIRELQKPEEELYEIGGKRYSPVIFTSMVLKHLNQMVSEQGGSLKEAVLTVPSDFTRQGRENLEKACRLAGIRLRSMVEQPCAVAVYDAYLSGIDGKRSLICDLGARTTVSIVEMIRGTDEQGNPTVDAKVVSTGSMGLGCQAWEDKLYQYLFDFCCDENGLEPEDFDDEARGQIHLKAAAAMRKLSTLDNVKIKIKIDGIMTIVRITRQAFEQMTRMYLEQVMQFVAQQGAKAGHDSIGRVILTGGGSEMAMLREAMNEKYPGLIHCSDPLTGGAMGAAICGVLQPIQWEQGPLPGDPAPESENPPETQTQPEPEEEPGPTPEREPEQFPAGSLPQITAKFCSCSIGMEVCLTNGVKLVDNLLLIGDELPASGQRVLIKDTEDQSEITVKLYTNRSTARYVELTDGTDPARIRPFGVLRAKLPRELPKGARLDLKLRAETNGIHADLSLGEIGPAVELVFYECD